MLQKLKSVQVFFDSVSTIKALQCKFISIIKLDCNRVDRTVNCKCAKFSLKIQKEYDSLESLALATIHLFRFSLKILKPPSKSVHLELTQAVKIHFCFPSQGGIKIGYLIFSQTVFFKVINDALFEKSISFYSIWV